MLAKAQQWEQAREMWVEAETAARSIERIEDKASMLKEMAVTLAMTKEYEHLLHLVQRSWQQADTRENAIRLFPLVTALIPLKPEFGFSFYEAFAWVDTFLRG